MHGQSCCFVNINRLPFCRSRCRRCLCRWSSPLLWSRNVATIVACVASVSLRGSSRKLGQERKKKMNDEEGGGESSNFRAITRLETLTTQATTIVTRHHTSLFYSGLFRGLAHIICTKKAALNRHSDNELKLIFFSPCLCSHFQILVCLCLEERPQRPQCYMVLPEIDRGTLKCFQ